jgi:hypothetical protein
MSALFPINAPPLDILPGLVPPHPPWIQEKIRLQARDDEIL